MIRPDAREKLSGEAVYGTDLAVERMLYGAFVPSPVPNGVVRRLDLGPARRVPGVVAAVGPDELDRLCPKHDLERPLFPKVAVSYYGQPLAAVAAESPAAARAAVRAVVLEVDAAPPLVDVEELYPAWPEASARGDARTVAHVLARDGDLVEAFARADLVHEETYRTSGVHQVAIEPHACVAEVADGRWSVTTTTQTPFGVREDVSDLLGIPPEKVVVTGTWVGGGFGGKGSSFLEPYALLLAAAAGRPVRLALSYREEFQLGRTTLPMVVRLETAVRDGAITGRRVRLLLDSGASLPGRDFATGYAIAFLLGPYRVGAFEMEGYAIRTNKPPFGPHRAPLAPQCAFALESHTDSLARRLGIDPVEFRLRHVWREGDTTPLGLRVGPFGLAEALERARALRDRWRADGSGSGRGLGVACGFWSTGTGAGGEARLRLGPEGLAIVEGEREIGSGSVVGGLVDVAVRVTGLPPTAVRVVYENTATAPYDTGVFGSRTVGALGQAVAKAAASLVRTLADRLGSRAPVSLEVKGGRVVVVSGRLRRSLEALLTPEERRAGGLVATGKHYGRSGPIDERRVVDGTFYGYQDFTATVALAEVAVDKETGQVSATRVAEFLDVGVALNPALVTAQVEGGVAMGLGTALTEEMLWRDDGRLGNPGLLDYRVPTITEVPPLTVELLEGHKGAGPFGAKGVGEPPIIPVPAAVANALADATGARVTELPLSPERVARALKPL